MALLTKPKLQAGMRFFITGYDEQDGIIDESKAYILLMDGNGKPNIAINSEGDYICLSHYDFDLIAHNPNTPEIQYICMPPSFLSKMLDFSEFGAVKHKKVEVKKMTIEQLNVILFSREGYHVEVIK